jgi:hypothetical protein
MSAACRHLLNFCMHILKYWHFNNIRSQNLKMCFAGKFWILLTGTKKCYWGLHNIHQDIWNLMRIVSRINHRLCSEFSCNYLLDHSSVGNCVARRCNKNDLVYHCPNYFRFQLFSHRSIGSFMIMANHRQIIPIIFLCKCEMAVPIGEKSCTLKQA